MRQAAIVLHATLLTLAATAACSVDVPDADTGEFACKTEDDCSAGFICEKSPGEATGVCAPKNSSGQECVPGSGTTTCGVGKTCDATGHCVSTTPAACTATTGCTGTEACVVSTSGGANTCATSCTTDGATCTPKGGSSGSGRCAQVTRAGTGTALVCAACTSCSSGTCEARVLAAANLASGTYCNKTTEACSTTSDDDADGLTNCDDRDCVAKPECTGGGTPGCTPTCTGSTICVRDTASSNQGVCVASCTGDVPSCDADRACAHVLTLPSESATRGCVACAGTCSSMLDSTCVATAPTAAPVANASVDCVSMWAGVGVSATGDGVSGLGGVFRSVAQLDSRFMYDLALLHTHQPIVVWSSGSVNGEDIYTTHYVTGTPGQWRADPTDMGNTTQVLKVTSGTFLPGHFPTIAVEPLGGSSNMAIAYRGSTMLCAQHATTNTAGWTMYDGACAVAFSNSNPVYAVSLAPLGGDHFALAYQTGAATNAMIQPRLLQTNATAPYLTAQDLGTAVVVGTPGGDTKDAWPSVAGVTTTGGANGALLVWAGDASETDARFETMAKRDTDPLNPTVTWNDVTSGTNFVRTKIGTVAETRRADVAVAPTTSGNAYVAVEARTTSSAPWNVTVLSTNVGAASGLAQVGTMTKFFADIGEEAEAPAIDVAADGTVVVAYQWRTNSTSPWQIRAQVLNASSGEWEQLGPSQYGASLSDPAEPALQPRVAIHASTSGGPIACVAWVQQPNAKLYVKCINRPQ